MRSSYQRDTKTGVVMVTLYLSTYQSPHFFTSTWVKKCSQYFHFYQSFFKWVSVLLLEWRMCVLLPSLSVCLCVCVCVFRTNNNGPLVGGNWTPGLGLGDPNPNPNQMSWFSAHTYVHEVASLPGNRGKPTVCMCVYMCVHVSLYVCVSVCVTCVFISLSMPT